MYHRVYKKICTHPNVSNIHTARELPVHSAGLEQFVLQPAVLDEQRRVGRPSDEVNNASIEHVLRVVHLLAFGSISVKYGVEKSSNVLRR